MFAAVMFAPALAGAVGHIDPNAFYVDKDHVNASNTNNGSAGSPWLTIQHGVNQLSAGNRLYVKESAAPYFEPYRWAGSNYGGVQINVSGTASQPIIIEGYPGERPIVDQQLAMSTLRAETELADNPNASKNLSGFFFYNSSDVILRNFEITQTNGGGVQFDPARNNKNVVVENMRIHHLYGLDNIGGITLSRTEDAVVRNNIIHDIYDVRSSSNPITSEPFGLHSGIHGYRPANALIENNLIYNVNRGVFQKTANEEGKDSNEVRRNVFYNLGHSAYSMEVIGSGAAPAFNAKFYENIVYDALAGVTSVLPETNAQSVGVEIYNNTFYNVGAAATLRGQKGIEFYNNIISGSTSVNFSASWNNNTGIENEIDRMDCNLYEDHANKWILERSSPNAEEWTSLSSWQSAFSVDSGTGLLADPDVNSFEADPLFVDAPNNNFRLEGNSPAIGQGCAGETLGAYGLGNAIGVIGLPGDFNGDNNVNGADFLLWQRDGSVGSLSDWENNYGASASLDAANAVPEPTFAVLFGLAAIGSLAGRHRRRPLGVKASFGLGLVDRRR